MKPLSDPKYRSRIFLVSLVSLAALVLILTTALITTTIHNTKASLPKEPEALETSLPSDGDEKVDPNEEQSDPEPTEEPKTDPLPKEVGNGLLFSRNGDGTCRLSGLGNCTDACVVIPDTSPDGDLVTEIEAEAFLGKSGVAAVQIPSTVQAIGERAFADCSDLLYLSVSAQNRFFCDVGGVLYSKDKRVLLQYPTLCASGSVKIPIEVKEIREMAFYNCPYLAKIYYEGSAADWDAIRIGSKNYALSSASKQFYAGRDGK